jgi:hypothetical protein
LIQWAINTNTLLSRRLHGNDRLDVSTAHIAANTVGIADTSLIFRFCTGPASGWSPKGYALPTRKSWLDWLRKTGVRISMDGKGRFLDNIFVERLWRRLKYECVYLHAWEPDRQSRLVPEREEMKPHLISRSKE